MPHGKEPELTGRIVVPGDPQYDSARQEFNSFFDRFPLVIVFAQETQDVVNAVRWARFRGVPFRMRSGRHNYEGLSVVNAGLVIDVTDMNRVEVDPGRGTATVQTGLRNFPMQETLGSQGLVVPSGLCPTTGIAGVTQGGGHSILSRPWGLTIDNLLEVEMVDANGRLLRANKDRNDDLFWALRGGGGGNFGVVTSFRFRTRPIDTVAFTDIQWDLCDLEPVLRTWQEYTAPGSDERQNLLLFITPESRPSRTLTSLQSLFPDSETLQSLEPESSQTVLPLRAQGVFLGSAEKLRRLLEPLLRAGSPRQVTIEEIPWLEAVVRLALAQPGSPLPFKATGPFTDNKPLPDKAIATIRRFIESAPTPEVTVFFHGLNGAVADVPSRATAYFWRKAWSHFCIFATWSSPDEVARSIRWVEDFTRAMLPFTRGVYVNTPDLAIEDWPEAYYGRNFNRLTRVKRRFDPENVFNYPQSIPPAGR